MKTAVKYVMMGSFLFAFGFFATPLTVQAQSEAATVSAVPANTTPKGVDNAGRPLEAGSQAPTPVTAALDTKLPDPPSPAGEEKGGKSSDLAERGKVPDSVKDVIKRLNTRTEDVTLDDLNNAREAVAKLDALIDIEKRLVDLDKIRQEREKANRATMINAVPISQLTPLKPITPAQNYEPPMPVTNNKAPEPPPLPPAAAVDVLQIEGSNNHYVALVKDGDTTHMVRAGDHLSDGSIILSVSKLGVELQRNNKIARLIEVKDVQSVFGVNP